MSLLNFFKKKVELTEEELFIKEKLKKIPKKQRKKALINYNLAKNGYYLRVGEDIDNRKFIIEGIEKNE